MAPSPVILLIIISVIIAIYYYCYSFTSFTIHDDSAITRLTGNDDYAPRSTNANANVRTPPAIFIFGDSTADVGTNEFIPGNPFRADVRYYGVDFANSTPNGRFSNRFITVDFLSQMMGFKRSPLPFLHLINIRSAFQRIKFRGVNFASAGSGLLNTTFEEMRVIPMSEQVNQFIVVRRNLIAWMGRSLLGHFLSKSIFLISIGSNDILDYFATSSTMPQEGFIRSLMAAYENDIKILYNLGGRKFGIISVLPMGCCPGQRVYNETGGCLDFMNDLSLSFYLELNTLLYKIKSEVRGFKYSLGNTYGMTMKVIQNPANYNFTNVDSACCGSGRLNAEIPCNPTANLCENRSEYAFWDWFHPTDTGANMVARSLYGGQAPYVSPINFGQLVADIGN